MPLHEYTCRACGDAFEAFVTAERRPECPACGGRRLERRLSTFATAVGGSGAAPQGAPMGPCGTCGSPDGPGSCGS